MIDSELTQNLVDLNEKETHDLVKKALQAGSDPLIILEACREGMSIIGKRFDEGEYFLPELIMAGEIFNDISKILQPSLGNSSKETKGEIVFGTVKGDIHDIGKDIVVGLLRGVGYEVHDLGVEVEPKKFVEKIRETGAPLLGLSGLITTAYDSMKETVDALVKAGIREQVKVIIGGGLINEKVKTYTGADAYGNDPTDALDLCKRLLGGN